MSASDPPPLQTDPDDEGHLHESYVVVVGGGLAGMAAAYELSLRGARVALFEASDRLGGKAGSDAAPLAFDGHLKPRSKPLPGGVASDQGHHVFPKWYVNTRALWERIGIRPEVDVQESGAGLMLAPAIGEQMATFVPEPKVSRQELLILGGLALETDEAVDPLTLGSYLATRPDLDATAVSASSQRVVDALGLSDAEISARAVRNALRQWLPVFEETNRDLLRGSLHEKLIAPLATAITREGGAIHLGHALSKLELEGDTLVITVRDHATESELRWSGKTVLAVPFDVLRDLGSPALFRADVGFSELHRLDADPFSALDVFFTRRLPGIPPEHFSLAGSRHAITGVDIGQHWPALMARDRTVLQLVARRSRTFLGFDDLGFVEAMREELVRYFPALRDPANVEAWVPHRNADARVLLTGVGQWENRLPPFVPGIDNVWFAGDHVKNETDVASLEGAVRSGLVAAEGVRRRLIPATAPIPIRPPVTIPWLRLLEGSGARLGQLVRELLSPG